MFELTVVAYFELEASLEQLVLTQANGSVLPEREQLEIQLDEGGRTKLVGLKQKPARQNPPQSG